MHSPHLGSFRYSKGHLSLFRQFKLIWDQLGSFGLPWLLVPLLKILFHLKLFFFIWTALGWSLRRHRRLPLIYLYSSRGKEIGVYACFLWVRKHLQIENSGTTSQIQMKLTWHIHHVSFFHLQKSEGLNGRAGEGCIQNNTKTCHVI